VSLPVILRVRGNEGRRLRPPVIAFTPPPLPLPLPLPPPAAVATAMPFTAA